MQVLQLSGKLLEQEQVLKLAPFWLHRCNLRTRYYSSALQPMVIRCLPHTTAYSNDRAYSTGQQNLKSSLWRDNHKVVLKEQFILNKNSCITRAVHVTFRKKSTDTVWTVLVCFTTSCFCRAQWQTNFHFCSPHSGTIGPVDYSYGVGIELGRNLCKEIAHFYCTIRSIVWVRPCMWQTSDDHRLQCATIVSGP